MIRPLTLAACLALAPAAHAQEKAGPLDITASTRLRAEAIDGQARAGFGTSDELFNIRSTLGVSWRGEDVTLAAELWDSRVYGAKPTTPLTTGEVNAVELVQLYATANVRDLLGAGTKTQLQAGRFTLNIGSRRLVAADDYRNTTNGYTGLRADIAAPGGVKAVLIYTLPQVRKPDDFASLKRNAVAVDRESFDLVLWGGTVSRDRTIGDAMAELSFYHLGERDSPSLATRDRSLNTAGGRVMIDPKTGHADVEIEAFYQWGRASSGVATNAARTDVSASFVHADAGYTFAHSWKPRVSVEYDRASGDRPGGANARFDTLFGMRRADLAPAGLYNAIARTNLETFGLRLEVEPSKRLDAFVTWHSLWLASATDAFSSTGVVDRSGASGRFAGNQIDARLRYWLVPDRLRFEFDGVLLAKGHFLRDAPNAPSGRTTRYGSINLTMML
ncbi:alginate export family protein [Sphingomonas sp. SUN019]|uniref:alginate export family protein n=1 Tax=Sphingomonas sp. SUN019 TaxID=2937788 RepID=UPI002164E6B9|nr:alginate export family protein [Sphingomonas sp. SUN019]UVO49461.1 alginate export family protein [Sphingomonas sp. SUN019]